MQGQWPLQGPCWPGAGAVGFSILILPTWGCGPAGPPTSRGPPGPPVKPEIVLPQAPTASQSDCRNLRPTRSPAQAFTVAAGHRAPVQGPFPPLLARGLGPGRPAGGPQPAAFSAALLGSPRPDFQALIEPAPVGAHRYLTRSLFWAQIGGAARSGASRRPQVAAALDSLVTIPLGQQ